MYVFFFIYFFFVLSYFARCFDKFVLRSFVKYSWKLIYFDLYLKLFDAC